MRQGEAGDYLWFVVDGELEARLYAEGARVTGDAHPLGGGAPPGGVDLTSSVPVSRCGDDGGAGGFPLGGKGGGGSYVDVDDMAKAWAPPAVDADDAAARAAARWQSGSGRRYDLLGVLRPGDYFGARGAPPSTPGLQRAARCTLPPVLSHGFACAPRLPLTKTPYPLSPPPPPCVVAGEYSALLGQRRTATVVARTPGELCALSRESVERLLARWPELAADFEGILQVRGVCHALPPLFAVLCFSTPAASARACLAAAALSKPRVLPCGARRLSRLLPPPTQVAQCSGGKPLVVPSGVLGRGTQRASMEAHRAAGCAARLRARSRPAPPSPLSAAAARRCSTGAGG